MLKKISISLVLIAILLFAFIAWFVSLLGNELSANHAHTKASELPYLANAVQVNRGKILAVVTNVDSMGSGENMKKVGYELTELSRAYSVFKANGFDVDIASPQGGKAPMVRDDDEMGAYDYAFLNDQNAMAKVNNTLHLSEVKAEDYQAIYFVGGKGTMFDFPDNNYIQDLTRDMWQQGKVIAAVCHGPAALINVRLDSGDLLIEGRELASFSNDEELFLYSKARNVFPYLLEDKLVAQGAKYRHGHRYLNNVVVDGRLITGQNPWSVWQLAEETIKALGYQPVVRQLTPEEYSISLLGTYADKGYSEAHTQLQQVLLQPDSDVSRNTLAVHAVVSVLTMEFGKVFDLLRLLNSAKTD